MFEFKGGIQVYSYFFLDALQRTLTKAKYEVFLKHDSNVPTNCPLQKNTQFHFAGNWSSSLRTLAFASQILGYGLRQHPDLVITTHVNFTIAAYWLKRFTGIPYWTVAHGVDAWDVKRPALLKALQHADKILAVSNYTRDRLLKEQNLDPERVGVLPNTFDAERFKVAPKPQYLLERYQLGEDRRIILTVGRLDSSEQYKGYDQILKALPKIRDRVSNVHYILVGKGNDRPRVEQLISELHLEDCVTLTGFVPDSELPDHYNLCDVFAMPSKGEGFGIVYLEALASGKPTLGGDRDGAIDALCQGELGVLVNPDDVAEIEQALIKILQGDYSHPILYNPEILRQKVIEVYGFDRFKQRVAELFQQAELGVK